MSSHSLRGIYIIGDHFVARNRHTSSPFKDSSVPLSVSCLVPCGHLTTGVNCLGHAKVVSTCMCMNFHYVKRGKPLPLPLHSPPTPLHPHMPLYIIYLHLSLLAVAEYCHTLSFLWWPFRKIPVILVTRQISNGPIANNLPKGMIYLCTKFHASIRKCTILSTISHICSTIA